MDFTHNQKKFIKKNVHRLSLEEISTRLDIPLKEVETYLKDKWGAEKYEKFLKIENSENNNEFQNNPPFNLKNFIKKNWIQFAFLTILVFIAYFNSLNNAFVSDDIGAIKNNPQIGNIKYIFSNLTNIVITFLDFIAFKIGGLNPFWFRLNNVIFHLGTVFLIFIIISLLFSETIAFVTAAIFSVHPIITEAIVWISGGTYVVYTFFCLLSFLAYILAKREKKFYIVSGLAYVLALLSSNKTIVFLLIILFWEIANRNYKRVKILLKTIVLSGVIFGIIFLPSIFIRLEGLRKDYYMTANYNNPAIQIPLAVSGYLQLIIWPDRLSLYQTELFVDRYQHFLITLITLLYFAWIYYAYKNARKLFFFLSFFIISLLPTLTPLPIAWIVAERYVYMGSIGIFFVFAYYLDKLIGNKKKEMTGYIIFIVIIIGLIVRTITRNADWKNEDTLWFATVKTSPSSPNIHNNMGDVYMRRGDLAKAEAEFKLSTQINPIYADGYHNLANVYRAQNKMDLALANYRKAAQLNPAIWQSYQNMGAIYWYAKDYGKALVNMRKAAKINPNDPVVLVNLAMVELQLSKTAEARESLNRVLAIDPANEKAKEMLKDINK